VRLASRSSEFYGLLAQAGENAHATARAAESRFRDYPSSSVTQEEIKALEHEGDRINRELNELINVAFVTPFDREDIFKLANAVDDVVDAIDNVTELLGVYGVETTTRQSLQLCELLVAATGELSGMLGRLKGLRGSAPEIEEIDRIEHEADELSRSAVSSLFADSRIDPVIVIRWKDIYDGLEEALDACKTASHLVRNVLIMNA